MQRAQNDSWCGPAAAVNALACLGRRVSQRRVAELASTGVDGTDEHALMSALTELGASVAEWHGRRRAEARGWLLERAGMVPLILCVDHWGHWVCVVGRATPDRVLVADGFGARGPGVTRATRTERLLRRWRAAACDGRGWYGISVW